MLGLPPGVVPPLPLPVGVLPTPRFIIRSSYGNDSIALIQWAREQELKGVVVMYSDTGWARRWWSAERVPQMEAWVRSIGFRAERVVSIGMEALVMRKGWPFRLAQFCTETLKITPAREWLEKNDPDCRAIILTGVRRDESENRKAAPHFRARSINDGGRCMLSPLVEMTEDQRNDLIRRAGFEPLSHRSDECRCINSGKEDIKRFDEYDISEIERIETQAGFTAKGKPRTMYRPGKHMGAVGIRQIAEWAHAPRGKYSPPVPFDGAEDEERPKDLTETDAYSCDSDAHCGG